MVSFPLDIIWFCEFKVKIIGLEKMLQFGQFWFKWLDFFVHRYISLFSYQVPKMPLNSVKILTNLWHKYFYFIFGGKKINFWTFFKNNSEKKIVPLERELQSVSKNGLEVNIWWRIDDIINNWSWCNSDNKIYEWIQV